MGAKVIEVIETDLKLRGEGEKHSPLRRIIQYWSKDGTLLAEVDHMEPYKQEVERLGRWIQKEIPGLIRENESVIDTTLRLLQDMMKGKAEKRNV